MITFKQTALTIAIGSLVAFSSIADAGKRNSSQYKSGHSHYDNVDFARVINVRPITKRVKVSNPVERCYDKKVWHEAPRQRSRHSHKNEIVGALIGAAVGNRVGKRIGGRNGRDVATAAGAVIGGVIGNDHSRRSRHYNHSSGYYDVVQHCETHHDVSYEEKVVAYKVKYKYRGKIYKTRTKYHPGDRLKVRVSVTPYEYS